MLPLLYVLLATARSSLKAQRELALENLALRQQLAILQRKTKRPRLTNADRAFWVALSRLWPDWQSALILVKPQTVIGWHRKGFKLYWTSESRHRGGRPPIDAEIRTLIRRIVSENPTWGAPRVHGDWSMPSPTTRRPGTSSGTQTRSMARTSFVECVRWA
jgi:putative transposase